jgi:polyisoprenoid-binding protein YceI
MARYRIDPERSHVWVDARSSLHAIHTETSGLEGFIDAEVVEGGQLDLTVVPQGHLELPIERLQSGNPLEDREMRRRVDARRYPTIVGELTEMKALAEPGRFRVQGDLTFRGVKRSVSDEMVIESTTGDSLQLDGEKVFDIREFGMEPPRILMLKVYPEVTVRVSIVADREG